MRKEVQELLKAYQEGNPSDDVIHQIEALIESEEIGIDDVPGMSEINDLLSDSLFREIGMPTDEKMHLLLNELKEGEDQTTEVNKNMKRRGVIHSLPWREVLKIAAVLVLGVLIGSFYQNHAHRQAQYQQLAQDVSMMKYQMINGLLEKPVVQERLKAVKMSSELDVVDTKVSNALLQTFRHDPSVNVRLAALDVLYHYVSEESVRSGLIQSIQYQDSPLVQIRLAELMAEIQEEEAVAPLERWIDGQQIPGQFRMEFDQHLKQIKSLKLEM